MIIIDDCSPDNVNNLIKKYIEKDNRIKLIKLEKNIGPANARNEGIKQAKGKYIAFLDSDDIWFPKKLEKQLKFMQDNNVTYKELMLLQLFQKADKKLIQDYSCTNINYLRFLIKNNIPCLVTRAKGMN